MTGNDESIYRATLDSINEGILIVDQAGKVVFANRRFYDLWQVPADAASAELDESLLARLAEQLVAPDEFLGRVQELHASDAESQEQLKFKDGRIFARYSRRIQCHDGLCRIWCFNDISERTNVENALRLENEKNLAILHGVGDGLHVLDVDGKLIDASHAFCEMTGYGRDEMLGKSVLLWETGHTQTTLPQKIGERFASKTRCEFETRYRRKDGTLLDVAVGFLPALLEGRPVLFGSARDITQRKHIEQRLSLAIEASRMLPWEHDPAQDRIFFDETMLPLLGLDLDDELKSISGTIRRMHPDDVAPFQQAVASSLGQEDAVFDVEYRLSNSAGQYQWIHTKGKVIKRAADGSPLASVGTSLNINAHKQAEAALKESERQLLLIANNIPGPVARVDRNLRFLFANDAHERVYGKKRAAVMGSTIPEVLGTRFYQQVEPYIQAVLGGEKVSLEVKVPLPSGEIEHEKAHLIPDFDADRNVAGFFIVGFDITELKRTEAALRESELRWKFALEGAGDGMFDHDYVTDTVYFSPRVREMLGYAPEEFPTDRGAQSRRTHPDDLAEAKASLHAHLEGKTPNFRVESRVMCKDGSWKWILYRGMVVNRDADGKPLRVIGTHSDISDRKHAEERIQHLAYRDPLTGLPNRALIRDRIEQSIAGASRENTTLALLFLDLDHFKTINDSLGHVAGDWLLKEVSVRLSFAIRERDTVGRLGGDEFLVLLPGADADSAANVAQKLLGRDLQSLMFNSRSLMVTPSIGIALYPKDGTTFDELLKAADTAMYRAKEEGRNTFRFYTREMNQAVFQRMVLESGLHRAIDNNEFVLHYQPKYDLETRALIGAEALIRWYQPEMGLISPIRFIPVAEESSLIEAIGKWVLHAVCRQIREWNDQGLPPLRIAINFSARQFSARNVVETVCEALASFGLKGDALEVEITEGLLAQDLDYTLETLLALQKLGVHATVDDFGTGYSSLSYLKRFPIYRLKIDQSFIRDLVSDADDRAIATAVVTLGHSLGMRVIAEGVETAQQMEILREIGCDEIQGYHLGHPMPADEFAALMKH